MDWSLVLTSTIKAGTTNLKNSYKSKSISHILRFTSRYGSKRLGPYPIVIKQMRLHP